MRNPAANDFKPPSGTSALDAAFEELARRGVTVPDGEPAIPAMAAAPQTSKVWQCSKCKHAETEATIERCQWLGRHSDALGVRVPNHGIAYCPKCLDETLVEGVMGIDLASGPDRSIERVVDESPSFARILAPEIEQVLGARAEQMDRVNVRPGTPIGPVSLEQVKESTIPCVECRQPATCQTAPASCFLADLRADLGAPKPVHGARALPNPPTNDLRSSSQRANGVYDFASLQSTGLLWLINRVVFHPRGLALALCVNEDEPGDPVVGWTLTGDGSELMAFESHADDCGYQKAEAFLNTRRAGSPLRGRAPSPAPESTAAPIVAPEPANEASEPATGRTPKRAVRRP